MKKTVFTDFVLDFSVPGLPTGVQPCGVDSQPSQPSGSEDDLMLPSLITPKECQQLSDNEPYELLQVGAGFAANLLAQAIHAMAAPDGVLRHVTGESIDLIIWIPEKGAPVRAGDVRPFQLPSCVRRLVGAGLAERGVERGVEMS